MTEQTKAPAEIIVVPRARLAFARIHKAEQSRGPDGQPRGTAKFSCTLLIDPSSKEGQESIAKVKAAAAKVVTAKWGSQENWPKANPATGMGGLIKCFGLGNELPKVYAGFKDMFYVKCADTTRPRLGSLRGQWIEQDEKDGGWYVLHNDKTNMETYGKRTGDTVPADIAPYAGCYVKATISPWVYFPTAKRPQSANGVNMNLRTIQFAATGEGFGGGRTLTAEEEFGQMAGDAPAAAAGGDPW